ncbi:MAG: hypothetical protein HZB62_09845, partial [Nitrospirae bacterium]|nr:hypothetical protein [Nitrospirota bacterium]
MRQNTSMIGREVRADMRGLYENEGQKRKGADNQRQLRQSSHLGIMLMAAIALILVFALAVPATVNAATSGPNSPTLAANNTSIGTNAWATPANALTSDNAYATAAALSNLKVTNYLLA